MPEKASIKVTDNGPLIVKGSFRVLDGEGREHSIERAVVALCRCGHSEIKPFCDGSHARIAFRSEVRVDEEEPDRTDAQQPVEDPASRLSSVCLTARSSARPPVTAINPSPPRTGEARRSR